MEPKLTFINLGNRGAYTLPANRISVNITKTQKSVSFNQELSEKIREGEYNYLRVGTTGFSSEVYFVFCKKQTPDSMLINTNGTGKRIIIASSYITDTLCSTLGIKPESQHLCISGNVSNSSDFLTFKVTKQ